MVDWEITIKIVMDRSTYVNIYIINDKVVKILIMDFSIICYYSAFDHVKCKEASGKGFKS